MRACRWMLVSCLSLAAPCAAQTTLPPVSVTAPAYARHYGGYLISGDFKVDPRMPYVVFPAQALVAGDILSIRPVHLNDDEYLVLQECVSADCRTARLVRVWSACGTSMPFHNSEERVRIAHENKYFIWLERLPVVYRNGACSSHFDDFEAYGAPLTLVPQGRLAAEYQAQLAARADAPPIPVKTQSHRGATFVVTFAGGSTVHIQRMHASR